MDKKCIVVCSNANGNADYFPIIIRMDEQEIKDGNHFPIASEIAFEEGYEHPMIVTDEAEPLFKAFSNIIDWNSVATYDENGKV